MNTPSTWETQFVATNLCGIGFDTIIMQYNTMPDNEKKIGFF
jgi:hypothetical protein